MRDRALRRELWGAGLRLEGDVARGVRVELRDMTEPLLERERDADAEGLGVKPPLQPSSQVRHRLGLDIVPQVKLTIRCCSCQNSHSRYVVS